MSYKKLLKLASYFEDRDRKTYIEIMKLAALSLDGFQSLILKCYPESGSPENERLISKRVVLKRILDPKESNCTLEGSVEFIKNNNLVKNSDHNAVWQNPFDMNDIDYDKYSDIIARMREKLIKEEPNTETSRNKRRESEAKKEPEEKSEEGRRKPEDKSEERYSGNARFNALFSKLQNIKAHHDVIKQAVSYVKMAEWHVHRAGGFTTLSKVRAYDPTRKVFEFEVSSSLIKHVDISDVTTIDPEFGNSSLPLVALSWLKRSAVYPISIKRTSGEIQECLLDKVYFLYSENKIICEFSFYESHTGGVWAKKLKMISIGLGSDSDYDVNSFYAIGSNAEILR